MRIGIRWFWALLVAASLGTAAAAQTIKVLDRERLGNNTEDITFVASGHYKDHVAILDGYEVYVVKSKKNSDGKAKKAFDLTGWSLTAAPRGMTYIESEEAFAFIDPTQPGTLFIADDRGAFRETRAISFMNGFMPTACEALSYIPASNPSFPDHLLMVAWDSVIHPRIEVIRRDGQVEAEILVAAPAFAGLVFAPPDRLHYSSGNAIGTLDLAGNIIAPPATVPPASDLEGLARTGDGAIVAADYALGTLFFFTGDLVPTPARDRSYVIGVGLSMPRGGSWNRNNDEHLLLRGMSPNRGDMFAVDERLRAAALAVDLPADAYRFSDSAYIPAENLYVLARGTPRALDLFDGNGVLVQRLDLAPVCRPVGVAYVEATNEFAVTTTSPGVGHLVYIVGRDGVLHRTINLTSLGVTYATGIDGFDPSHPTGGRLAIAVNGNRAIVIDLDGNLKAEVDLAGDLGLPGVTGIAAVTTGMNAGAFAVTSTESSTLVVFRLD